MSTADVVGECSSVPVHSAGFRFCDGLPLRVLSVYAQMDEAVARFQAATGLACPSGCGHCCFSSKVEATVTEMLPLAAELLRRGEEEAWLSRLVNDNVSGPCVFFAASPDIPGHGRCRMYSWRPTLCRLFGFAAVTNKKGRAVLAACRQMRMAQPDVLERVRQAIDGDLPVPRFNVWSEAVAELSPSNDSLPLRINEAAAKALQKVGLAVQLSDPKAI